MRNNYKVLIIINRILILLTNLGLDLNNSKEIKNKNKIDKNNFYLIKKT